jgi:hypothetical protein
MRKIKWFTTDIKIPIESILEKMLSCQFTQNVDEGFLIIRSNKNLVEGKFIEKLVITERFDNPFGYTEENKIVKYQITKFCLTDEKPIGLIVIDPPKSMRAFFGAIHKISGINSLISEITVDPLAWALSFENSFGKIKILNISSTGINIANNSLAKVSIAGEKDIRRDFIEFIGSRYCFNQLVKFSVFDLKNTNQKFAIELQKNAAIRISGEPYEDMLIPIKNGLIETYNLINK